MGLRGAALLVDGQQGRLPGPRPGPGLATCNGQVYGSGIAPSLGGVTTSATSGLLVGIAASAKGYWVVTVNGGVRDFGDANFLGDLPALGKHLSDIVANRCHHQR